MVQKFDTETLLKLVKHIDKSSAVTWTGKGGVKERILQLIADEETSKGLMS